MKMREDQRGMISIYLVIVFAAMLFVVGALIDLGRIKVAQNQLRRIADASARGVMAGYNGAVRSTYGLFALDNPEPRQDFRRFMEANLTGAQTADTDILAVQWGDSRVELQGPLGDTAVLKQQILEAMKYKAPVDLSRDLMAKLREIAPMARFFDESNEKRKSSTKINLALDNLRQSDAGIKQAGSRLRQQKMEWVNNQKELTALRKQPSADSKRLEKLTRRQKELSEQMEASRNTVRTEIARAEREKTEMATALKELETPRDLSVYNNAGSGQGVEVSDQDVNKQLAADIQSHKQDLAKIENEITRTKQAVQWETASLEFEPGVFDRMGLESATQAQQRVKTVMDSTVNADPAGRQTLLQKAAEYQARLDPELGRYVVPEAVNGNVRQFTAKDSDKVDDMVGTMQGIFTGLNVGEGLGRLRDEIYINEYILTYFSYLTTPARGGSTYPYRNTEAEFICYGGQGSKGQAVTQLYLTRVALDSAAYFAFSKAPVDLLARTVYSVLMGTMHAVVDTFMLLVGENVPVASMMPGNPLEKQNITMSYKDHLRLFLLLRRDEQGKLGRIKVLLKERSQVDADRIYTVLNGQVQASIRLWFLPLAGFRDTERGPFGTAIRDGRCYMTKVVQYGY